MSICFGKIISIVLVVGCIATTVSNAYLLGRKPLYNNNVHDIYDTGEIFSQSRPRAIITVHGSRNQNVPSRISFADNILQDSYPRGIYNNFDRFNLPVRIHAKYSSASNLNRGNLGGPYNSALIASGSYPRKSRISQKVEPRRDFFDPDFGVKAAIGLQSNRRSRCKVGTEVNSEIPELGVDSANLNVDCDLNPMNIANAAIRVAKEYKKNRQKHQNRRQPKRSSSVRKKTRIELTRQVERDKQYEEPKNKEVDDADNEVDNKEEDDDNDENSQPSPQFRYTSARDIKVGTNVNNEDEDQDDD